MIGLGIGNLFVGPISDSVGRKKPLIIVMTILLLQVSESYLFITYGL